MRFIKKDGYRIWDGTRKPLPDFSLRLENFRYKQIGYGLYRLTYKDPRTDEKSTRLTRDEIMMRIMAGEEPTQAELERLRNIATGKIDGRRPPIRFQNRIRQVNEIIKAAKRKFGPRFRAIAANGVPFMVDNIYAYDGELFYRQKIGMANSIHATYKHFRFMSKIDGKRIYHDERFDKFIDGYISCIRRGENPENCLWNR